ncbi:GIY-YIG nuclease family protein [soil metagenome]
MAWTYILECSDGSYYVGSTVDLQRRLSQHQRGEGAAYTRHRRLVELVWAAEYSSIRQAYFFEKQIQGWRREKREALIEGRCEDLPDLASRSWASLHAPRQLPQPAAPEPSWVWEAPDAPPRPVDPDDPWAPPPAA